MAFMDWNSSYSIGVDIFDEEHKKLVAIINALHDALETDTGNDALLAICDRLVEYTLLHFRHEEMYFEECAYPEAAEHTAKHSALRREVFVFRKRAMEEEFSGVARELAVFLRDWYAVHILVEDAKYAHHLQQRQKRSLAAE